MPKPKRPKLYWKDALRQVRIEPEAKEAPPPSTQKWSRAYRQAQADLTGPGAIVWLPDEIIALLREEATDEETSEPPKRCRRLPTLLLAMLLLLPVALSYLLAYRRISTHLH